MHLTDKERVRFHEEAMSRVSQATHHGRMRGVGMDNKSKCCNAKLGFRNLVIQKAKRSRIIVADVSCMQCLAYLGESTVNTNHIKEKRNGV